MSTQERRRWFRVLAGALAAWYVLASAASFTAAVLWRERVSRARFPPAGMLVEGTLAATVAGLALASAVYPGRGRRLWWGALGLSFGQLLVDVMRRGFSVEEIVDTAIIACALVGSLLLLRRREDTHREDSHPSSSSSIR
jgi:hypothetical protein